MMLIVQVIEFFPAVDVQDIGRASGLEQAVKFTRRRFLVAEVGKGGKADHRIRIAVQQGNGFHARMQYPASGWRCAAQRSMAAEASRAMRRPSPPTRRRQKGQQHPLAATGVQDGHAPVQIHTRQQALQTPQLFPGNSCDPPSSACPQKMPPRGAVFFVHHKRFHKSSRLTRPPLRAKSGGLERRGSRI